MYSKVILLTLIFLALTKAFANPQAINQITFTYQVNGDLQSQTLSWAPGQTPAQNQLTSVKQSINQISVTQAATNTASQINLAGLPLPQGVKLNDLRCTGTTHYVRLTANAAMTTITSDSCSDIRNGEVVVEVGPKGNQAVIFSYDQLGRKIAITNIDRADNTKTTTVIRYLRVRAAGNHNGYGEVTVTYPDSFKKRILINSLGRVYAKQVNTCADGPITFNSNTSKPIAGCSAGSLIPNSQFRTITSYNYTNSDGVAQQKVQTSTDALGAKTDYRYNSLGQSIATIGGLQENSDNKQLTTIAAKTFFDNVDQLQVSYQPVSTTPSKDDFINPGYNHTVQVKYFDNSGKVIRTRLISLYALQQATGIPANQLFNNTNRAVLENTLTDPSVKIGLDNVTHYNALLQPIEKIQPQKNGFNLANYHYNNQGLVDSTKTWLQSSDGTHATLYQQKRQYNLLGEVSQITLNQTNSTSFAGPVHRYNEAGELVSLKQTNPDDNQTQLTLMGYDSEGKLTAQADVYANITYCNSYNSQGQIMANWDVPGTTTLSACLQPNNRENEKIWTYYKVGNSQQQPAGKLKSIAFASSTDPDTITYSYYLDGTLKQIDYADGLSINYQYDTMGETSQVNYSRNGTLENQSSYTYGSGSTHHLLTVQSGNMQVSYSYDDMGNVTHIQRTATNKNGKLVVNTSKTYTSYDRLNTSRTYKGNDSTTAVQTLRYLYQQGQLTGVIETHPQFKPTNSNYNQFNHELDYNYDGDNRLQSVTTKNLAGVILKTVNYSFNTNNDITHIVTNNYDANGKFIKELTVNHSYNGFDQLTDSDVSYVQPGSVQAGNMTYDAQGNHYQYNHLNQLTSYTGSDGITYHYSYYPNGALHHEFQGANTFDSASDGLTFYYNNQGQIIQVTDKQGNWTSYLGGLAREATTYYNSDGSAHSVFYAYQGKTPSGWLSGGGQASWQQPDAYGLSEAVATAGQANSPTPQPSSLTLANHPHLIGFNGCYQDLANNHLVFMGARVYSTSLKCFLQRDSADVFNHYAYAQGNPVLNYDPSGHFSISAFWKRAASIVAYYAVFMALFALTDGIGDAVVAAVGEVAESIGFKALCFASSVIRGAAVGGVAMAGRDTLEKYAFGANISGHDILLGFGEGVVGEGLCAVAGGVFDGAVAPWLGIEASDEALIPEKIQKIVTQEGEEGAITSIEVPGRKNNNAGIFRFNNFKRTLGVATKDALEPAWYTLGAVAVDGHYRVDRKWWGINTLVYFGGSLISRGIVREDSYVADSSGDDDPYGNDSATKSFGAKAVRRTVERGIRYWALRAPARGAYYGLFKQHYYNQQ